MQTLCENCWLFAKNSVSLQSELEVRSFYDKNINEKLGNKIKIRYETSIKK